MKKFSLFSLVALVAASLVAAPEKVASVRIAGTEKITAAVGQLGSFTGNPALGAMFSGSFMQSEAVQYFGPTRQGANVFVQIYADAAKTNDRVSVSILYPVVAKKAKFLKHHKKAVEKGGVIVMPADSDGDSSYVVFSEDGKWAALADTAELAKDALRNVAEAERPLENFLLKVDIASSGMAGLARLAEATRTKGRGCEERIDRATLDLLNAIDYLTLGVKVADAGLDFTASAKVKPGSEFAKVGLAPYDEKRFASLGKDVFFAGGIGRNGLMPRQKGWKDLLAFLRAHGLKPDFIVREEKPGLVRLTLDPAAMVAYLSGPATNDIKKLDAKRLASDFQKFAQDENDAPFAAQSDPVVGAFAVKGLAGAFAPAERLAATLPELAGKKPYYVQCGSAYGLLRALLPNLLKLVGDEDAALMAPMVALLPPESVRGVACAAWCEGDSRRAVMRISPDELKGFASLFTVAAACAATQSGKADEDGKDED